MKNRKGGINMGYSATALAFDTLDKIKDKCAKISKSQNIWKHKGKFYMFEIGRENESGAITGSIYELLINNINPLPDRLKAVKKGGFKINPDGSIGYGGYGIFKGIK